MAKDLNKLTTALSGLGRNIIPAAKQVTYVLAGSSRPATTEQICDIAT